ncbi:broad specificity phosphatase PhoE [Catenulispora sp. GP43]|uniref:histidine phosphatase family protein n=1 Tax=Catenulispora sp. GP43 TaxID=3156263 RepID=UPI0035167C3D
MPVIHLVRHGQASADAADYDVLSALGDRQARVAGTEFARRGLRDPFVVCGTLDRQRDTADALIAAAGLDVAAHVDPRWNEYDHLDLLTRYPMAATGTVQDYVDHALTSWIEDPDGGWQAFQDDAVAALAAVSGAARNAIVVTSGGVIAAVCGALLGVPPAGIVALNRVSVNVGITTLVHGSRGTSLLTFNDHAHLAADRSLLTYR